MRPDTRLLQIAGTSRAWLSLSIGLGLATALVLISQAFLLSDVIAGVFGAEEDLTGVLPQILGYLALAFVRVAAQWAAAAAAGRAANEAKQVLRDALSRHILALGPTFTANERTGEIVNTMTEGVEALDAYIRGYLPQLALAALVPLAILVVVFPLDPLSGAVLLLTAPLIPLFMVLIGDMAGQRSRKQWRTLSRLSTVFLDVLQGLTTLKLLNRSRQQLALIREISDRFRQSTMDVLRVAFLSALVLEILATISIAVVAVEIGLRLLRGGLPFSEALLILVLAPDFYQPLRQLGARFHAGTAGTAAAERIFAILATSAPKTFPRQRTNRPAAPPPPYDIRLENVSVRYGDRDLPALDDVTLSLPAGEQTALVGPSGAGKSTVVALLLGFIQPSTGRVTVNGRDLATVDPAAWRAHIAWVPQRPTLFSESVAANIWRARPNAPVTAVEDAARQARIHEFILTLPDGYDTPIGERGLRLSGGQAQRLALARAFLKDAPVLILDEATSHLDALIEAELRAIVTKLACGRTVLTVTHRPATAHSADSIAVLTAGRIVEAATPALLPPGYPAPLLPSYPAPQLPSPLPSCSPSPVLPSPPAPAYQRLLRLIWPHRLRMALAALLGFVTVGSGIALMSSAGFIISKASLRPSIADLQLAIVSVRFFGISRGGFRYLERLASHDTTFRLLARLRVWFYESLEPLAPARLLRHDSGDLLARAVGDIEVLENFFIRAIAPPAVALLVALGGALILSRVSPALAGIVLVCYALAALAVPLLGAWLNRRSGAALAGLWGRLNIVLVETVQGAADLLAMGQEEAQRAHLERLSRRAGALQERQARVAALQGALVTLLAQGAAVGGLVMAIPLVTAGRLEGVWLAALALGILAAFEAVLPLPEALGQVQGSLAAAGRLFDLVDAAPAVLDPPTPAPAPTAYGLRARALGFSYEPGGRPALAGIDFDLPAGGRMAVVGPSGAGKSTLANLLLRFYPLQEGEISLGGRPLQAYQQEDVRRAISVVAQRTHLFAGTIRDNLLLARPQATMAELDSALAGAQLAGFVADLPEGLDTWIGEGGVRLSGGERQRLAIARAVLRDAPILVLDEATANLDPQTEEVLMETLEALMAGRTTLVITHRLSLAALTDEILVLKEGRIVQRGAHAVLLAEEGLYRHMWSLQHPSS